MAYDDELADRVRAALSDERAVRERRMFGGLAFMLSGHMTVCVSGRGGLMVRVDPDRSAELVSQPGVERMVMGGRTMAGWILVSAERLDTEADLIWWVDIGRAFVSTLAPKG